MPTMINNLLILLGTICLSLGLAGIVLPVLPTTPFLLLSAGLYCRSSPKLYQKLMASKRLGPYIKDFRETRALPVRVKVVSVSVLWITILASAFLAVAALWLRILLLAIASAVTIHILSYKTKG